MSRSSASRCAIAALLCAATAARAQSPVVGEVVPTKLKREISERREIAAVQHARSGERLINTRHGESGARELAVAYALSPSEALLMRVAGALRAADLDREALLLYKRLHADPAQRSAVEEALSILRAKLGEEADDAFEAAALLRSSQEKANQLCQQGDYQACGAAYASIYAMKPLPRLLFNMAQAARRAERLDESVILYHRFLEESAPSPLRKEATQYVFELSPMAFRRPLYRQWWIWGSVLGVIAAAAVTGGVLGTNLQRPDPQTALGSRTAIFSLSY